MVYSQISSNTTVMKYLFIVQGEGRGHLTQAMTMEKMLLSRGHEVVGMLVGKSKARILPDFFLKGVLAPVRQFTSVNFLPSAKNRTADMGRSIFYNLVTMPKYSRSLVFLKNAIKDSGADVVVNFYELLTGLVYLLYNIRTPQICIGHQYLFLHKDFNLPHHKGFSEASVLNLYSRLTAIGASRHLALSFREMPPDHGHNIHVVPPLLRKEVLDMTPTAGDYIHGYMLNAGFATDVMSWHKEHPEVELRFFWDKWSEGPVRKYDDTLTFYTLDDKEFLRQMAGCMAYASTAGFESICEAVYLGKPILMVPSHIEQKCNALDATRCGVGISSDRFDLSALLGFARGFRPDEAFPAWARSAEEIIINELETCI